MAITGIGGPISMEIREVIRRLPRLDKCGEELPSDLWGSVLLRFGTTKADSEAGELVIEYLPNGRKQSRTLVLLFDGLGMWIEEAS